MTDHSLADIFAPRSGLPAAQPVEFDPLNRTVSPMERRYALALQSILTGSSDPYALAVATRALSGQQTAGLRDATQGDASAPSNETCLLKSLLAVIAASQPEGADGICLSNLENAVYESRGLIWDLGIDPDTGEPHGQ